MCILCVIQKWSRRIATMLPWLVIPLIGLWALSQLLPPAFRFEITSPRLACVFVLLVTLFWYEILMPQLSAWRARRNARLRERKRLDAIEMHKLRKTATRRCRNCLTPYREQNPGGGRFMCSYCGHISKRPVLDLPIPPGISDSGILKDFLCKGGKILNRKVWSDNGLICGQDWMENSNWVGGSFMSNPNYWQKTGSSGIFRSEGHCLTEKSYSRIVIFACELMTSFLLSLRWLWGKVFRVSSSMATTSSGVKHSGILAKRTDNGAHLHESRGEKARRKAEEKRQARLEKEILEEEEKKQREEVARLVEERRRLRDEKMEAEKDRSKGPLSYREKDNKKEAEKKRQERRREKDKASSKSNSDAEELEKRTGKESDQKRDCEKRSDVNRREHKKYETENGKFHGTELFSKGVIANNHSRVNTGAKYLDRMRGTLLSSSKAFSRGSFFGKVSSSPASISKEIRSNGSLDHFHTTAGRKDLGKPELIAGKLNMMGADRHIIRPAISESQSVTTPKKSWQQLFTCSSSIPPSANSNVISRPSVKLQAEVMSSQLPAQTFDNPINFGLPSPFTLSSLSTGSTICTSESASATELMFPRTGEATPPDLVPEEPELFEDPCYVPDPVSLLGPVSESLHNFQLDLGTMCGTDMRLEKPLALKNLSTCSEVSKPSPIVSPLSRSRVVDNNHASSGRCTSTPKEKVGFSSPKDDTSNANDEGTWQMWNSSPLGPDGLGLVVSPVSWILPPEQNRLRQEDTMNTSSHKTTTSLFTNEDPVFSGPYSPQKMFPACVKNGGTFNTHVSGSSDHDPWLQALFPPLTCSGNHFGLRPQEEAAVQNEMNDGSPSRSASSHTFEVPAVNCWSKKERSVRGSVEGKASSVAKPHIGGLYSASDVQSLWSVDWENRK